jgi:prepilin-type N-terminal cleavage/methylation domain-containing protein
MRTHGRQSAIGNRQPEARAHRGFSLIEVLMAIIILGIGVISIAALFPAGIAQQRLAADDVMGPTVANHAISVIRSKVRAEDFGSFEDYYSYLNAAGMADPPAGFYTRTIRGDWGWLRPSFLLENDPTTPGFDERGAIDIFSHRFVGQRVGAAFPTNILIATEFADGWPDPNFWTGGANNVPLSGIPFNRDIHSVFVTIGNLDVPVPPRYVITQRERYYPMSSDLIQQTVDRPRPQYVWDCMFRRYQGRMYVAIFVYRVSAPGGAASQPYVVQPNPSQPLVPPVPIAWDLEDAPWDILYGAGGRALPEVRGVPANDYNPFADDHAWQNPRQWILDQNNNIHRVLSNRRAAASDLDQRMIVELTRPLSPVRLPFGGNPPYANAPDTLTNYPDGWPTYAADEYVADPSGGPTGPGMFFPNLDRGVVTRFWYMPSRMEISTPVEGEFVLTPVYVTVKEL